MSYSSDDSDAPYELRFKIRAVAAKMAKILDDAGVPYVCFGRMTTGLFGSEVADNDIDFIIPDAELENAMDALVDANYSPCVADDCNETYSDRRPELDDDTPPWTDEVEWREKRIRWSRWRYHWIALLHWHLHPDTFVLRLYSQSRMLWWLPTIQPGKPAADDPHFVLSNDVNRIPAKGRKQWDGPSEFRLLAGRGVSSGPWLGDGHGDGVAMHPIKVLSGPTQVEAAIFCLCTDLHYRWKLDWRWWCMLYDLAERKIPGQRREQARYKLRDDFQMFWDCFRGHYDVHPDVDIFNFLLKIREDLMIDGGIVRILEQDPMQPPSFMLTKKCVAEEERVKIMEQGCFPYMHHKVFVRQREMLDKRLDMEEAYAPERKRLEDRQAELRYTFLVNEGLLDPEIPPPW